MKKKRLLAILLALAMLVGMLPASVFAASAGTAAEDDGVSTAATETVSLTVGNSTTITVTGSYSASDFTYDSSVISVTTSVASTDITAGTKYESLSSGTSFYIYYTENGTTYYLVLSVSSGEFGGSGSLTVSYTTDISQATLITYTSANSGSGGSLSFTSGNSTYYLGVSTSSGGSGGSSVSLTASTSASTTWSYSSSTGFSTSVETRSEGNQGGQGGGGGSTTTTYYLSGTGLSSSANTYDYAISYTATYMTTITITGVSAGTTSITVGETTYSITVTESSSSSFELDISAYLSTGVVYWDMDDENNTLYDTSSSQTESGANKYVTSVTLGTSTTTDETTGESTTTANTVPWADSTTVPTSSSNYNWSTAGLSLSSVYSASDRQEDDEEATLTITPAEGYYVTNVVIVCAAYAPTSEGGGTGSSVTYARVSPYDCSTYENSHAFTNSFDLSSATSDGSGIAVSTAVKNLYFAHSGFITDGFTSATTVQAVYFILVEVEKIPTPAYVEYDFGEIVNYIQDELGTEDSKLYSAFSTASGWTDAATDDSGATKNVYKPTDSSTNGGVLTDDTQFKYTYDDSSGSSETSADWKHYANSISEAAVEQAAAAGYVFAGWAVTWYKEGTATSSSTTDSTDTTSSYYNNYSITFSDSYNTGLVMPDDEVYIVGHVRLVAQWVKANDITQVIDYGLAVSADILAEIEDSLTLQALTDRISSRTSVTQDLYGSFTSSSYTTLNTTATIAGFAAVTTEDAEDSTEDENPEYSTDPDEVTALTADDESEEDESTDGSDTSTETTTYSSSLTSAYGSFSLASTANSGGNEGVVYTLSQQMTGIETVEYQVTLSYVSGSGTSATTTVVAEPTGTISVIPATSMYYEEDFGAVTTTSTDEDGNESSTTTYGLVTYTSGSKSVWTASTDSDVAAATYQESGIVGTEGDSTYGSDTYYLSNLKDSNGSTMYVDTSNGAASFTYTFTGTGTAIYSRISTDSAYIRVVVTNAKTNKTVETKYIDTRILGDVSGSTTLYNIPVYDNTELDYGTYTVTVTVAKAGTTVSGYYDDSGNEVKGSTSSGKYFYLDGIRVYNPLGTAEGDSSDYDTAAAAYAEDNESNTVVLNIVDKIVAECLADDSDEDDDSDSDGSDEEEVADSESSDEEENTESDSTTEDADTGFITLTDVDGNIVTYATFYEIGPDNELYLDATSTTSEEESSSTSYTVSFYLVGYDTDEYDIYLGLKAPDGTESTVQINGTSLKVSGSADCYYSLETYLTESNRVNLAYDSSTETLSEDSTGNLTGYKITITGTSGLTALTYLKVTGEYAFEIAYSLGEDVQTENELTGEESATAASESAASASAASVELEEATIYLLSTAASYSSDDDVTDEDMLDDDSMGVDPEDDTDADSESEDTEEEENEDAVFEPETFSASITYLKLLRYASITVKTSSDVSYITVNGTKVTGRSFGSSGTKTFSYTASRISSGTTFEIIAYDSDGTASEPVTLTAK